MTKLNPDRAIADSISQSPVDWAPVFMRPYLRLARVDRPVGFWLLAIPCWAGLALGMATVAGTPLADAAYLAALLTIGAIAMRGAGCTYNDIVDRDLDAKVARTADRPLAAKTVSLMAAWVFLGAQLFVGLVVLLSLPEPAQFVALAAIPIIAAYPFMKRITWFPQAWLGLAMNWGAGVAYVAVTGMVGAPIVTLMLGLWAWTVGYDTIYACQDVEDDALVGVKSTARAFGKHTKLAVGLLYAIAAVAMGGAVHMIWGMGVATVLTTLAFAACLFAQVWRFDPKDTQSCLRWFKFNRIAGLVLVGALLVPVIVSTSQSPATG